MTNRLFLALEIPEDLLDEFIEIRDEIYGSCDRVKWEPKEKLHITLKFLGDTQENHKKNIIEKIEKIVNKSSHINLNFSKFGLFYRDNAPKILWAGLKDSEQMLNLVNKINCEMELLGFKKEKRKFKPHLTFLRLRGKEDMARINYFLDSDISDLDFKADTLTLFQSELLPKGSVYKKVRSFKLK